MPRIELIPEVLYEPNTPYHWETDNLPLKAIIQRQELINLALDNVIEQVRDGAGTAGSMANRLNQSINEDGSLKTAAVDETLHSIEEHTDTDDYVRMTKVESDKLALIANEATDLKFQVDVDSSSSTLFSSGTVIVEPSTTITPTITAPNIVKFHMVFPESAAHQHYYGLNPVHANLLDPDFTNYKVNSMATPFVADSLRVYVNGVRIFSDVAVYAPGALITDAWTLLSFNPDEVSGTFALSTAITVDDVIKIDFDISLI